MQKLFANQTGGAIWDIVALPCEELNIKTSDTTLCYFIVQNIKDEPFIRELATRLISSGCREFCFWGAEEPRWHLLFDETYIEVEPDFDENLCALTSGNAKWEDFVDGVFDAFPTRDFAPTQIVLFYDDKQAYDRLLKDCEVLAKSEQ